MDINMTLIGQVIAMVVFVWFCMKFVWPMIMGAIEQRQTDYLVHLLDEFRERRRLHEVDAVVEERLHRSGHALAGSLQHVAP